MSDFTDIRMHAEQLQSDYGRRDDVARAIENIFLMRDNIGQPEDKTVILTRSPDNRQAVVTARRLLSTTYPQINVPFDRSNPLLRQQSEPLERFARAMLSSSDHSGQKPLHHNVSFSMLLYDESHIIVNSTADLVAASKGQSSAYKKRMERLARTTPYIFRSIPVIGGYPEWDAYGLTNYVRVRNMTVRQIIGEFGRDAEKQVREKYDPIKDWAVELEVWESWNLDTVTKWISSFSEPFRMKPLGLPFIPIVCRRAEGSDLFPDFVDQREPFLLTEYLSGLGARKSLMLTALYSKLRFLGFLPPIAWEHDATITERPGIKQNGLFQYIDAGTGRMVPLNIPMDPAFEMGLEIAERKGEETTISKTATGQYLGSGTAFSTHALLSQLGRLPLETIRSQSGEAIADALRMAFQWMKADNVPVAKVWDYAKKQNIEINLEQMDEDFDIECELDVALPQDLQSQAGIFTALYDKVPGRMLFERILKLGQYDDAMQELMDEQATKAYFGIEIQKLQQAMMMEQQMAQQIMMQQQQQQAAMAQQQAQVAQQQAGMEAQMVQQAQAKQLAAQQNPQQAMMGQMTGAGLPPEMAQMGMGPMEPPGFEEGGEELGLQ